MKYRTYITIMFISSVKTICRNYMKIYVSYYCWAIEIPWKEGLHVIVSQEPCRLSPMQLKLLFQEQNYKEQEDGWFWIQ